MELSDYGSDNACRRGTCDSVEMLFDGGTATILRQTRHDGSTKPLFLGNRQFEVAPKFHIMVVHEMNIHMYMQDT